MGYRCADVALFTSKWLAYVLDGQLLALYLSLLYYFFLLFPIIFFSYCTTPGMPGVLVLAALCLFFD